MDPKQTRKDAEKAARALLDTRARYIGDLRVAHDNVDANTDLIAQAATDAETILTEARARAADVTAAAQRVADNHVTTYTTTYKAATDAGWTPAELTTLGFTPSTAKKPRAKATPTPTATPTTNGGQAQD